MAKKEKTSFKIRAMKSSDFEDIANNFYTRYEEIPRNPYLGVGILRKKPSWKEEKKWFDSLSQKIWQGHAIAIVAEVNGKVVGMCDVEAKEPVIEAEHLGTLGIAINEDFRSMGIGTALMNEAIKKSKGKFKLIRLSLFHTNKAAFKLYKRFGFRVYGKLPEAFERKNLKFDGIFMYRKV